MALGVHVLFPPQCFSNAPSFVLGGDVEGMLSASFVTDIVDAAHAHEAFHIESHLLTLPPLSLALPHGGGVMLSLASPSPRGKGSAPAAASFPPLEGGYAKTSPIGGRRFRAGSDPLEMDQTPPPQEFGLYRSYIWQRSPWHTR